MTMFVFVTHLMSFVTLCHSCKGRGQDVLFTWLHKVAVILFIRGQSHCVNMGKKRKLTIQSVILRRLSKTNLILIRFDPIHKFI